MSQRACFRRFFNIVKSMLCALLFVFPAKGIDIDIPQLQCSGGFPNFGRTGILSYCYASVIFNANGSDAYPATLPGGSTTITVEALKQSSSTYADSCRTTILSTSYSFCKSNDTEYYLSWPTGVGNPTRPGFSFYRWRYCNSDGKHCEPASMSSNDTYQGNKYLFAEWESKIYNIKYNLNNGSLLSGESNPASYAPANMEYLASVGSSGDIVLKNPVRSGYWFEGWCDGSGTTTNCQLEKKIPIGSYGDKEFSAKWTQVTGTKTMYLLCGADNTKTKTTTGTSFSVGKVSSECGVSGDKRNVWICGGVVGNFLVDVRKYDYRSSNISVSVNSNTMFCAPAAKLASFATQIVPTHFYWYFNNAYWVSEIPTNTAGRIDIDNTVGATGFFNDSKTENSDVGTTFWWVNPNDLQQYKVSTSVIDLDYFFDKTNVIAYMYGYKIGLKCTVDKSSPDFYIAWPYISTGDGGIVEPYIRTTCAKVESNSSLYTDDKALYCKMTTGSCEEYRYISGGGGGLRSLSRSSNTRASCPGNPDVAFYGDSTCYYKAAWCSKGKYFALVNGDATTAPCHTCDANYYCDACDYDVENCNATKKLYFYDTDPDESQGIKICSKKTNYGYSVEGSDSNDDCYVNLYKNHSWPEDKESSLYTTVYYGTSGNHGVYSLDNNKNFSLNSLPGEPSTSPTGYNFFGWIQGSTPEDMPSLSEISQAYASGNNYYSSDDKLNVGDIIRGFDNYGDSELYYNSANGRLTLNVAWEPIKYKIAFNANASEVTGTMATMNNVYYGAPGAYTLTSNGFTRTGYDFDGWCVGATTCDDSNKLLDGATLSSDLTTTDGATVTLYARWTPTPYTITLNPNGGTLDSGVVNPISYNIESGPVNLPDDPDITQLGYIFDGWCETIDCDSGNETPIKQFVPTSSNIGNKYAYANWVDAVSLCETDNTHKSKTVTASVSNNTVTCSVKCADGYSANGYLDTNLTVTATADSAGTTSVTLPSCKARTYKVGLDSKRYADADDVTGESDNITEPTIKEYWYRYNTKTNDCYYYTKELASSADEISGNCLTKNVAIIPSSTGYTFGGYFNTKPGKGTDYIGADGKRKNSLYNTASMLPSTGNTITLYTKWTPKQYSVTYECDGTQKTVETATYGVTYSVLDSATVCAKSGYTPTTFVCSKTISSGAWNIDSDVVCSSTRNGNTIYLNWVNDDGHDGATPSEPTSCTYGSKFNMPFALMETGWIFDKWNVNSKQFDAGAPGVDCDYTNLGVYSGTATITASWTPETYTINYHNTTGASFATANPPSYTIEDTVTLTNPTKTGYTFAGWCSGSTTCDNPNKNVSFSSETGDKNYYAKWTATPYSIKYYDVLTSDTGNAKILERKKPGDDYPSSYTIEDAKYDFANFTAPVQPDPINTNNYDKDLQWVFDGWYTTSGFQERATIPAGSTGDKPIYAKWKQKMGTVIFVCSSTYKPEYIAQVGSFIPVLTKDDCHLDVIYGWSCSGYPEFENNDTMVEVLDGTTICRTGYKITYKGEGIQNNTMEKTNIRLVPDTYTSDVEVVFPSESFMNGYNLRPGYSFTGWFYNRNFTNATTGIALGSSGHKTVWARWSPNSYKATYDCGSTTVGSTTPLPEDIKYDATFTTADDTCVKKGYTFAGWKVSGTADDIKSARKQFKWEYTENKTFTAQWEPITYSVAFNGNENTGGTMTDQSFAYNESKALTANGFTRTGYDFNGWCDNWNATTGVCDGNTYRNEQIVSRLTSENGAKINLYAMWTLQNYTITYNVLKNEDNWDAEPGLSPTTYTTESENTLPVSINTTRAGYKFVGWCAEDSYLNTNCIPVNMQYLTTNIRDNVRLYAKWAVKDYNITYYVDYYDNAAWREEKTLSPETYNLESGAISFEKPTRDGCVFMGWCTINAREHPNCTIITTFTPTVDNIGDLNLYAKWKYKINYELNGGDGDTSGTYEYGTGLDHLPEPTRENWDFAGWYRSEDFDGNKVESISDSEWGPITLYAKWTFDCKSHKWLHVGNGKNDKLCLSETKPTGKSLGIMVDGVPYYTYLSERGETISNMSTKKLHVQIGSNVYNAHDASVE